MYLQLFFKRSTLYVPFVLVGAFYANEVGSGCLARRAQQGVLARRRVRARRCQRMLCGPATPLSAHLLLPRLCNCRCMLLQAMDTLVGGIWESRNQGKLFKHMELPAAEE